MLEHVTVLSAARAYEHRRDDLRLTALSTAPVQAILGGAFNFDPGGIDSPPPGFGPEPRTNPRSLVFNLGSWTSPEGTVTPVRSLTFSRQPIVLSIAGPSHSIDPVHEYLVGLLENVDLLGGSPRPRSLVPVVDHRLMEDRLCVACVQSAPTSPRVEEALDRHRPPAQGRHTLLDRSWTPRTGDRQRCPPHSRTGPRQVDQGAIGRRPATRWLLRLDQIG